jgi:hypothetical protein
MQPLEKKTHGEKGLTDKPHDQPERWIIHLRLLLGALRKFGAALQPDYTQHVDDANPEPVVQSVLGSACIPGAVIDLDRNGLAPCPLEQRWEKPMHVVEVGEVEKRFPAKDLQAAAGIWGVILEQPDADAVGYF